MDFDKVLQELNRAFDAQELKIERLEESLADRILALDDVGWAAIGDNTAQGKGPTLDTLKTVVPKLREMAVSNALHTRGCDLIFSYCFSEGAQLTGLKPAATKIVTNEYNADTLFSVNGLALLNRTAFTDGNTIVFKDNETKLFTVVPLDEITGVILDPNDKSKIRYLQRSWNIEGEQKQEWVPLSRWKKMVSPLPKRIDKVAVSQTQVAYLKREMINAGWTWGMPWSLPGMPWALAYSTYLQDNSKLVKALSMIAWSLTKTTKEGVQTAAAQLVTPRVGGTAINTGDNAISSVGVPSAQVNMNNGQPLAAMVATSFGVPVIALLSSPGATGGSYGAATTLDMPTIKAMQAKQSGWKDFFEEILRDLGSNEASMLFPPIEKDPAYRAMSSIGLANQFGFIWDDEGREASLQLLPVPKLHKGMPPKPEKTATVSAQGVAGSVPGGTGQDTTDHSGDNDN